MPQLHRRPTRRGFRVPRRILNWLDPVLFRLSVLRLRPFLKQTNIRSIVEASFAYRGFSSYRNIFSVQNVDELTGLAERFHQIHPRVIVEIGTRAGGTLFTFIRSNPQAELVVSIDLPGGKFGGGYNRRKIRLFEQFVRDRPQTRLACLRVDSHLPATLAELKQLLAGRPIDALFIDGDHSYAGVKQDFLMYGPLVRQGGLIAFHDIKTDHHEHHVMRFWREIRDQHQVEELCFEPRPIYGIGIVTVGSTPIQ